MEGGVLWIRHASQTDDQAAGIAGDLGARMHVVSPQEVIETDGPWGLAVVSLDHPDDVLNAVRAASRIASSVVVYSGGPRLGREAWAAGGRAWVTRPATPSAQGRVIRAIIEHGRKPAGAVVDAKTLTDMVGVYPGGRARFDRYLDSLLANAETSLRTMQQAGLDGDTRCAAAESHRMKPHMGMIGATELSATLAAVEAAARKDNPEFALLSASAWDMYQNVGLSVRTVLAQLV